VLDVEWVTKVSSNDLWVGRRSTIRQRIFSSVLRALTRFKFKVHILIWEFGNFRCQFTNRNVANCDLCEHLILCRYEINEHKYHDWIERATFNRWCKLPTQQFGPDAVRYRWYSFSCRWSLLVVKMPSTCQRSVEKTSSGMRSLCKRENVVARAENRWLGHVLIISYSVCITHIAIFRWTVPGAFLECNFAYFSVAAVTRRDSIGISPEVQWWFIWPRWFCTDWDDFRGKTATYS